MSNAMNNSVSNKEERRSPWPYAIVIFLTVVVVVNIIFIYAALKTDDGLVDEDYYEKGILYNKTLEDEAALGWQIALNSTEELRAESINLLSVSVLGKDGLPLKDASVRVILMRPATDRYDEETPLVLSGAVYGGKLQIPLRGLWDIKIIVDKDGSIVERIFRVRV